LLFVYNNTSPLFHNIGKANILRENDFLFDINKHSPIVFNS